MADKDVPIRLVTTDNEEATLDSSAPAWTYDSWFAGWYRASHEVPDLTVPAS